MKLQSLQRWKRKEETLNGELSNCKAKLLKFEEEKKEREKERVLLIENEKALKKNKAELEMEINEK